jgi:hypothetical protein
VTEREWTRGNNLQEMLDFVRLHQGAARTKAGRRRLRLFCCACVRHVSRPTDPADLPGLLDIAEQCAEGLAGNRELAQGRRAALPGTRSTSAVEPILRQAMCACLDQDQFAQRVPVCAQLATFVAAQRSYGEQHHTDVAVTASQKAYAAETAFQPDLMREIFGNPFRPLAARKFSADLRSLAQSCNEGDASVYPILADALADLGEEAAAAHCRQSGHVKGCHIVDWVRGMA